MRSWLRPEGWLKAPPPPRLIRMPATYFVVAGMRLLVSRDSHPGPLFRLSRASDSATLDVYPRADGLPDNVAIATWIGASSATIDRLYVQDDSGAYLSQSTLANRPVWAPERIINGCVPACFNGARASWGTVETARNKFMNLPSLGFDRQNFCIAIGMAPTVSRQSNAFAHLKASTTHVLNLATDWTTGGLCSGIGATSIQAAATPQLVPLNPSTSVFVSSAAGERFYTSAEDGAQSAAARTSTAIDGGTLGYSGTGLGEELTADVFWVGLGGAITDAEAKALRDTANAAFGWTSWANWKRRVLLIGDSNFEGYFATNNAGTASLIQKDRPATDLCFSLAMGGRDIAATYTDRATLIAPYITGLPTAVVVETCGQDLLDGDPATTIEANAQSLKNYLVSASGTKRLVLHSTTLVNPGAVPGAVITEATAYGVWVKANSAGASAVVIPTDDVVLGNSSLTTDTNYYGDGFHLTTRSATILADLDSAAIDRAFAAQPLT